MEKIAVVGAGSIGSRVVEALCLKGYEVVATGKDEASLEKLERRHGIKTSLENRDVMDSDVLILTVKPYVIEKVGKELSGYKGQVISFAAGVRLEELEKYFSRVGRVMTGVFVKDEIAGYAKGKGFTFDIGKMFPGAIETTEDNLSLRTWVACDTGLIGMSVYRREMSIREVKEVTQRIEAGDVSIKRSDYFDFMLRVMENSIGQIGHSEIKCRDVGSFENRPLYSNEELLAKEIEVKIRRLNELGMGEARKYYAGTLKAITKNLEMMSGKDIFLEVGGPGSFTDRIYVVFEENQYF